MFPFPDTDTGYYDPDEHFYELDAAHETAEEARMLEELQEAHSPESDPNPDLDYREVTITPARQQAGSIQTTKEAA